MMSEEAVAHALLVSMGIDRYEGRVVGVVLEHMHRSVQAILTEARELAIHAGRDILQVNDIELVDDLAAEDGYCASPLPSRETMLELARACNSEPIQIPDGHGLRLPPPEFQLTGQCYQFVPKEISPQKTNQSPTTQQQSENTTAAAVQQQALPPNATVAVPVQSHQVVQQVEQIPQAATPAGALLPITAEDETQAPAPTAEAQLPEPTPMTLDL
mmetsp:Transcript_3564/g.4998  ORF Transcript_3564/g.4998 Transcript_3564/m.4998 type:complete len:215 (+) Transcript_3564:35-679(+)